VTSFLLRGVKQRVGMVPKDFPSEILEFDASIAETHTGNAEVTDHPVEDGSQMTDHIRRTPEELQINGIVTDDPIVILRSVFGKPAVQGGDPRNRAQDAYFILKRWKDEGTLLTVNTTLRSYFDNMVITALSVARDSQSGRMLNANVTLREIVTATTKQSQPPTPKPSKKQKGASSDKGRKDSSPSSAAEQQKTSGLISVLGV
jgi:hypothetical protein